MKKNIEKKILNIIEKICNLKKDSLTTSVKIEEIKKFCDEKKYTDEITIVSQHLH